MRKVLLAAAVLLAASSTAALADEPIQRVVVGHDTYVYSVSSKADGSRVIDGERLPAREHFRYVVADGKVSGWSGNVPVRFDVADARGATRFWSR